MPAADELCLLGELLPWPGAICASHMVGSSPPLTLCGHVGIRRVFFLLTNERLVCALAAPAHTGGSLSASACESPCSSLACCHLLPLSGAGESVTPVLVTSGDRHRPNQAGFLLGCVGGMGKVEGSHLKGGSVLGEVAVKIMSTHPPQCGCGEWQTPWESWACTAVLHASFTDHGRPASNTSPLRAPARGQKLS